MHPPTPAAPARPRRAPRRWLALVVGVALVAAGCAVLDEGPVDDVADDPTPGLVAFVGDSITEQSENTLVDRFGDRWDLAIRALGGVRAGEWVGESMALASTRPAAVVVNLGTNDVLSGTALDESMVAMGAILDAFGSARCRYVVTVNEWMYSTDGDDVHARSVAYNEALRALAAEHDAEVLDWSAVVGEELVAGEGGGSVTFDTVHPTDPWGEVLLADLYAEGLAGCDLPVR